jgi:hypothetical protein
MSKTYKVTMEQQYLIETTDIEEVLRNYQFPDFCDCESIVGEPEYLWGTNGWEEMSESQIKELI